MKTIKLIFISLIVFNISSCINQSQEDEVQIKKTVKQFWKAVENNDLEKCKNLIEDSETFDGIIQSDIYFLHKNYKKINPNNILLNNIKIKDTTGIVPSLKLKYVQYIIPTKDDPDNVKKDLIITLMFNQTVGYNKIFNPTILENNIGWDEK